VWTEIIELQGQLIDAYILPRVLDEIVRSGGDFELERMEFGKRQEDPSHAVLRVMAPSQSAMEAIIRSVRRLGAQVDDEGDAALSSADCDGAFPEDFYATTNLKTWVRSQGEWLEAEDIEMDCGIVVERTPDRHLARCIPMHRVRKGQLVVVGHRGVRVEPLERPKERELFQFMSSTVSSEKPKLTIIRDIANRMLECREKGEKVLLVGGPAIIHTGAGPVLERIIHRGLLHVLFAGNALAAHDIEAAMFGTSLGVALERGMPVRHGHQNHLRAINRIRRLGGIAQAVEKGVLTRGVMHACIQRGVEMVLAGSIRDDGPLPDVITDSLEAQEAMRRCLPGVGMALLVATTLHSVAAGNLLPAHVLTVCVDINASTVTKLMDRGTFQAAGVVMDAESFLREMETCLGPGDVRHEK